MVPKTENNKSWLIRSTKPLDRDVHKSSDGKRKSFLVGETINLTINCLILDPFETMREARKEIPIEILDEDDNLPVPQEIGDIEIHLNNSFAEKVSLVRRLEAFTSFYP